MKKLLCLLLCLAAILAFYACGRRQNDEFDAEEENVWYGVFLGDNLTLNISAPVGLVNMSIEAAAASLTQRLALHGIDIYINIETYVPQERNDHFNRILGQFAAGDGVDIFVLDNFPLYLFIENGFLQDIYPMIDASDWNRNDFFENVLRGYEVNGRLYSMPTSFGFDFIGVNSNLPREFIDRFANLSHISMIELAEMYFELIEYHPEWGEYAFINFETMIHSFMPLLNSAVDFYNKTVNFPENFSQQLQTLYNAFEYNNRFNTVPIFTHTEENMRLLQERYVFFRPVGVSGVFEPLLDFETTYFTHFLPVANDKGELINRAWGIEVAVNANTNPVLAWAFIEELLLNETGGFGANSHIIRQFAWEYLVSGLTQSLSNINIRPVIGTPTTAIQQAANRIIAYADLPISLPITNLLLPPEAYIDGFDAMSVSQMEESITNWLNAERQPVTPPAPEIVPDDTVLTLTVRTPNSQTGVLRQAAAAMNASWRERGIPYVFELIVEDWSWNNRLAEETQIARLNIELMAGGGPDMFFFLPTTIVPVYQAITSTFDFVVREGHDIRTLAERGFVADINMLIENHHESNRSDFHEHILDALEINGELYIFPVSFGFSRVGINANIAQSHINRFMNYTSISFSELMNFYLDLGYWHLLPGAPFAYMNLQSAVINNMTPFIDFNARVSNINSPEFVNMLDIILPIFREHEIITSGLASNSPVGDTFAMVADEQIFEAGSFKLWEAGAFFTYTTQSFVHYIPFTDDNGNLLFDINNVNHTWASWVITNAGNMPLAWEFLIYMLYAYYEPRGQAATDIVAGWYTNWNNDSLGIPIKRAHFEGQFRGVFDRVVASSRWGLGFLYRHDSPELEQEVENAINTLAAQSEMPVAPINPLFPPLIFNLVNEPLEQLRLGLITTEIAAQRIHNAIQLWLME